MAYPRVVCKLLERGMSIKEAVEEYRYVQKRVQEGGDVELVLLEELSIDEPEELERDRREMFEF